MKYSSTRGGIENVSFEEALFTGFLTDGGILLPNSIPQLSYEMLKSWSSLSYVDLVKKIIPYFVEDEIPSDELNDLVEKAFSTFPSSRLVHLQRLSSGLNVLELFHGRTLAFKDLALSVLGQLFEYFLNKRQKHVTVLVATSGDTGSAAIEAVRSLKWVDLIVLLPKGRCTQIQELQMTTVLDSNIHVYRVDGTADDLDKVMKAIFLDQDFVATHNICGINSINWSRIMVQTAHYFFAYFQMCPECDSEVEVAVPTGSCGNITAGSVAVKMGLPVKFVCCVNSNDIVARIVNKGDISARELVPSLAPAMDIQVPYNLERILHIFSNQNVKLVKELLDSFEESGEAQIPDKLLQQIQGCIKTYVVDDEGIKEAMRHCWQENKYLLCPHSATAAKYHYDTMAAQSPSMKRVCFATASPAKFEEAVLQAGLTPQPTDAITRLFSMKTKYVDLQVEESFKVLKDKIRELSKV